MAVSMRSMNLIFPNILRFSSFHFKRRSLTVSFIRQCDMIFRQHTLKKRFPLLLVPFATVVAADDGGGSGSGTDKPFEPNDSRLRSSECLKNAAGLVVDSTSAVLSQTVHAIIDVERQYAELLDVLVKLIEYQIEVVGQTAEEERIADIIIEARYEINKVKKRKLDLALLFSSVEKLTDASGEVAFATGSNYASTCAGERLYSAQQEVKRVLAVSEEAERQIAYAEAQLISQLTLFAEKVERLKENVDSDTPGSQGLDYGAGGNEGDQINEALDDEQIQDSGS